MYQDTITVFNRHGDLWWPTVLTGVHLVIGRVAVAARYGWEKQLQAVAFIPWEQGKLLGGKEYVPPKVWRDLAQPEQFVTFQDGEEFDFFLMGRWERGPIDDTLYPLGFYQDMRRRQDGVFAISSVSSYWLIPHFEVLGR